MKSFIHSHRTHNGQEILLQKIPQNLCVNLRYLSYKTDVLAIRIFLGNLQESSVLSAHSDSTHSKSLNQLHQFLIHLTQHHLCKLHGGLIRHTEAVDKLRLHPYLADPPADFLSASMHDDRFKADKL